VLDKESGMTTMQHPDTLLERIADKICAFDMGAITALIKLVH